MNVNVRNLIYDAYRALGILRSGQQMSDDAADDALRTLNDLVDAWHLERLMIYAIEPTTYTLTGGTGTYTLGPGGTLGSVRPQRVEAAGLLSSGASIETPAAVLSLDQYRAGEAGVYVDNGYPLMNVKINPVPQTGGPLVLYCWVPFSRFSHVDSVIDFPAGYARALRWNLAAELAPMARIHTKLSDVLYQNIQAQADISKGWVKSFNSSGAMPEMSVDPALSCGCGYNVYTDGY